MAWFAPFAEAESFIARIISIVQPVVLLQMFETQKISGVSPVCQGVVFCITDWNRVESIHW